MTRPMPHRPGKLTGAAASRGRRERETGIEGPRGRRRDQHPETAPDEPAQAGSRRDFPASGARPPLGLPSGILRQRTRRGRPAIPDHAAAARSRGAQSRQDSSPGPVSGVIPRCVGKMFGRSAPPPAAGAAQGQRSGKIALASRRKIPVHPSFYHRRNMPWAHPCPGKAEPAAGPDRRRNLQHTWSPGKRKRNEQYNADL